MAEAESAHGELSQLDKDWGSTRFLGMIVVVLGIAFTIIYTIASIKTGNWSWHPFAHDLVRHTLESSQL